MREKFTVTYEVVTPESAEHGDYAEIGFVTPGDWKQELSTVPDGDRSMEMSLREAVDLFGVGACEDSGNWFNQCDCITDYRPGAETRYSLHPPGNITGASYERLKRLLQAS
jgi:hypothetical protein